MSPLPSSFQKLGPERTIEIITTYEQWLLRHGCRRERMDPGHAFAELSVDEQLAHAYYLCEGVRAYAQSPERQGKANRHLTAVQMCLSFAGWYTLEDLMNHNRSDPPVPPNFVPIPYR